MKKTLVALLLAVLCTLSLVSCSDGRLDYDKVNLVNEGYVTVGDYKNIGFDLGMIVSMPSETDILAHLGHMADHLTALDRAAADGDVVSINFVGTINGVEFDGGSADNSFVRLGSDMMIDGFEDGIVGMKAGEVKTIDVTFPEDYGNVSLNGKPAKFKITLNAAVLEDPEVISHINAENPTNSYQWQMIAGYVTVNKYPEKYLDTIAERIYDNYEYSLRMQGLMENVENYGITMEQCTEEAKAAIDDEFAVYAIVQAEGLTYTKEEFDAKASTLATSYGYDKVNEFINAYGRDNIELELYREKVVAKVTELSKISSEKAREEYEATATDEPELTDEPTETTFPSLDEVIPEASGGLELPIAPEEEDETEAPAEEAIIGGADEPTDIVVE